MSDLVAWVFLTGPYIVSYMGDRAVRIKSEEHAPSVVELESNLLNIDRLLARGRVLWNRILGVALVGKRSEVWEPRLEGDGIG